MSVRTQEISRVFEVLSFRLVNRNQLKLKVPKNMQVKRHIIHLHSELAATGMTCGHEMAKNRKTFT